MTEGLENRKAGPVLAEAETELEASDKNLAGVLSFIEQHLEKVSCPLKVQMEICLVAEEVFVNIAHYAYAPKKGHARVRLEISGDPAVLTLTFMDAGMPYNPLEREDPDITLPLKERSIGGLGILLTKKLMDEVAYAHQDGQNILTLKKILVSRKKDTSPADRKKKE